MDGLIGQNEKESIAWEISDEDLLSNVVSDITSAENYFDSYLKMKMITRYQLFNGDKNYYKSKFPQLSRRSTYVSNDIRDTVNWVLPSLVEVFLGPVKIITVAGRTQEDNPIPIQKLIQFQIQNQNKGFMIIWQWINDALKSGMGTVKSWWSRKEKDFEETVDVPSQVFLSLPRQEIKKVVDKGDGFYTVTRKYKKVIENKPMIVNVKPGERIWSPWVDEDGFHPFDCHRRYMTANEIMTRKKAGHFTQNVEEVLKRGGNRSATIDELDQFIKSFSDGTDSNDVFMQNPTTDESRDLFLVYECYCRYDINGDGLTENVIVTVINDLIVQKEINEYGRPVFSTITAFPSDYVDCGEGVADLLQDIQDLKTALIRQLIINIAQNNDRPIAMDESQLQAIQDLSTGKKVIRLNLKGRSSINELLQYFPYSAIEPNTFNFVEMLQQWGEQATGISRLSQGLDPTAISKTATGIKKIMGASEKKVMMIARIMAETGFQDLFRHLLGMNQKFINQDMVIRLTGEYLPIRPDDITGQFDVEVSAGIGIEDPQTIIMNLTMILSQILPIIGPMGLSGPPEVYNTVKRLLEEMGFKDIQKFIKEPQPQMPSGTPMGMGMGNAVTPQPGMPEPSLGGAGTNLPQ